MSKASVALPPELCLLPSPPVRGKTVLNWSLVPKVEDCCLRTRTPHPMY